MEISLTREKFSYAENIWSETHMTEEAMEMIVPDALPDILRIVGADAMVYVRAKDSSDRRVTVSGIAAIAILYSPDGEAGLRRMNMELPFSISAENEYITPQTRVTARLLPGTATATALNPRKLSARVSISAEISCYADSYFTMPNGIEPDDGEDIELLTDVMEVTLPVEILEKTFVASYEYQIPPSNPPVGELLRANASLTPEDVKVVGSKLIFKGTTHLSLLYAGAETGEITACAFDTEYSQILELENAKADSDFEIIPMLTGAYIETDNAPGGDNRRVTAELHVAAQCVARSKKTLRFIGDAYSSKYEIETENEAITLRSIPGVKTTQAVLRASLEANELSRVVSVTAKPGKPACSNEDGELKLGSPIDVEAIYVANDGSVRTVTNRMTVDASIPNCDAENSYKPNARIAGDVYGAPNDGGIEVRVPVELSVLETEKCVCNHITGMSVNEDAPLDLGKMPSLVISRLAPGDSLWTLAKRHHSTMELINRANELEDGDVLPKVLVIPKKR